MEIWTTKLKTREKRHQELITSNLMDFYEAESLINDKYDALFGHIQRLQSSFNKFKNK